MCLKDHGPLDKGMICFAACLPLFAYKSGLHRANHGNLRISDLQLMMSL